MLCKGLSIHKKSGGGVKGIIQSYQAKEAIDAGDFVELLTNYNEDNTLKGDEATIASGAIQDIEVIALSANSVLAVYAGPSTTTNYSALYACICTINDDGTITIRKTQKLYESRNSIKYIKFIKLEHNKILISFANLGTKVVVCEIIDNEITCGQVIQIVSATANHEPYIAKLTSTEVVVLYTSSSKALAVCTIDNLEVSVNTPISVETGISYITLTAISNRQVLLTYEDTGRLTAKVYSISNSVIFEGTPIILLDKMWINGSYQLTTLEQNKVLLCVVANNNLYFATIRINQAAITISELTTLVEGNAYRDDNRFSLALLNDNTAFVLYSRNAKSLHGAIIKVNGFETRLEKDTELLTDAPPYKAISIKMKENQICIGYDTAGANAVFNLFTYSFDVVKEIQKLQNENSKILGVAQKKGTDGQIIPVIVPDFSIKEEN